MVWATVQSGAPYGTNNGTPTNFACMDGSVVPNANGGEGQVTVSGLTQTAPASLYAYCDTPSGTGFNGHGGLWFPSLQRDQRYVDIDLEVKF